MQGIDSIKFIPLGQRALIIQWPAGIDPKTITQIWQLRQILLHESIRDSIVAYHSLTLVFMRPQKDFAPWIDWIRDSWIGSDQSLLGDSFPDIALEHLKEPKNEPPKIIIKVPVCYDPELAPDLEAFLKAKNLNLSQLIKAHTAREYPLYFYGFQPGFMYLGGLNPDLHHARKSVPAQSVPAGSVAIGGAQTGIYPNTAPGGWHVIGRCPLKLFNPLDPEPCLAKPGDLIKFVPINKDQFQVYLSESQTASHKARTQQRAKIKFGQIEVLKSGIYSSIQDTGRFGHAALGVPQSGAMDQESYRLANELLGNGADFAAVEITFGGAALKFQSATIIAITGADYSPAINQLKVAMNEPIAVNSGDVLSFSQRNWGVRSYLGVLGGVQSPKIMDSRSQYQTITPEFKLSKGTLIPIPLINNKDLSILKPHRSEINKDALIKAMDLSRANPSDISPIMGPKVFKTNQPLELEVLIGPEYRRLQEQEKNKLLGTLTVGGNDRMGYLVQEKVNNELQPIHTSAALPGTVQLTPGGQIIILMNDGQTTGGYPRIFQLTEQAKALLSQCAQGQKIKFKIA